MKKGDRFTGTVTRIDFPNKGIIELPQGTVTVKNVVPGQRIEGVITKSRADKCEGRVLELISRSPLEEPEEACPHFESCGGCVYQTLPYEEQVRMKEGQVKRLLDTVLRPDSYEFEGILKSPAINAYRNKMEFSFGDEYKDGPFALGMHRRGSFYDIVTTDACRIVHPDFCKILKTTKEYFEAMYAPFFHKLTHRGYLRHLLIRRAVKTREILVAIVVSGQTGWLGDRGEEEVLAGFAESLKALTLEGRIVGILHIKNDSPADAVRCDESRLLYGQPFFYEELLGLKFCITPLSFFQTNSLGAELLYSKARQYVGDTKNKIIFDLYSGTGTIAQILAPVAQKVVGVEIIPEAVKAAEVNARLNGLSNCIFIAGDVLKVIDDLTEKPDIIVLDPPRDGINPKALKKIIALGVERLIYISCKPTSLVRDLALFKAEGYCVEKACCVDMFPATVHVETVCLLSEQKT